MNYKELGITGVKLPEIGLGTWLYRGDAKALQYGMSLGATFIDTAEVYGTEDVVGQAIKGHREQVFLATKVSADHLKYDQVLKAAEGSLRRLGTDYIDLYQVHWPNLSVPIGETMGAMERLVDEGKIKYIGLSNFNVQAMKEAQAAMEKYTIVANQPHYSLTYRGIEEALLPYCQEQNVIVIAYSPLEEGALLSKPRFRNRKAINLLHNIAKDIGKTPAQVAINWCLCRPNVVAIPKADKIEHVRDDCESSGWYLSEEHIKALDRVFPGT